MKKILCALSVLAVLSASLAAFTWSGLVDNTTKGTSSDFSVIGLNQSNGLYLSMNTGRSGALSFSAEGLYKYNYSKTGDVSSFTNIVDVDLLKLSGRWAVSSGYINLSAGRFSLGDSSGVVFSQTSDGLYLSYETSTVKTAFYGGYTGLLNSLNVSMNAKGTGTNTQFYNLSASYIPLSAEIAYSFVSGSGSVGLQALYFIDPINDLQSQFYSTLSFRGSFLSSGSYSLAATVGSTEFNNLMMYVKASCSYIVAGCGILSIGGEYASGKQGPFSAFNTITSRTACNLGGGTSTSGIIMPVISAAYVNRSVYASLNEKIVSVMPEDEIKFEGFDTGLNIIYNLFSDVQLCVDINAFIDINDSSLNYYSGTIKASLAF